MNLAFLARFTVALIIPILSASADVLDPLLASHEVLLARRVQVRWPSPEITEKNYAFWRTRTNPFESRQITETEYGALQLLEVNRFSEYPGHLVGFGELLNSEAQCEKLLNLLRKAASEPIQNYPVLTKLELQHDFWEATEELLNSILTYGPYDETKEIKSRKLELVGLLKTVLNRLTMDEVDRKALPQFNVLQFLAENGYRTNGTAARLRVGINQHEIASHFRTWVEVIAFDFGPSTNLFRWLKGEPQLLADSTALFILVENMISLDSKWNIHVTAVPKTIRTEFMARCGSNFLARTYAAYRLDASASNKVHMSYTKLSDAAGGVPLADLPNAHNPYRLPLELSCFECHQGGLKIKRGDAISLEPLHTITTTAEEVDYKEKDSAFNILKAIAPKTLTSAQP